MKILNTSTTFHNKNIPFDEILSGFKMFGKYTNFGILKLGTPLYELNQRKNTAHIHMSIDKSYSMENLWYKEDSNIKGSYENQTISKMQELIETIKNITITIVEENLPISISINTFNDNIYDLIDFIIPDKDNIDYIFEMLDSITTCGRTNIENPLRRSNELLESINKNSNIDLVHILLTDGIITSGETEIDVLQELVSDKNLNIFIGYGKNHNSLLLKNLSEINGEYRFIDKFENTKTVYKEILNNIVYKIANKVSIEIENGLIYDYNINKWVNKCKINYISSCYPKTFQIQTYNIDEVKIFIRGICMKTNKEFTIFEEYSNTNIIGKYNDNDNNTDNLIKYAFRQKVQELIFDTISDVNNKTELCKFLTYMRNSMENNIFLTNDKLMETLCNDLISIINIFDHEKYKKLYSLSRHSSQGNEYDYTTDLFSTHSLDCHINSDSDSNSIINNSDSDSNESNGDDNEILISNLEIPRLSRQPNHKSIINNDL